MVLPTILYYDWHPTLYPFQSIHLISGPVCRRRTKLGYCKNDCVWWHPYTSLTYCESHVGSKWWYHGVWLQIKYEKILKWKALEHGQL